MIFFKSNPKSPSIWATFFSKFFCQEPSKIAQFGNLSAMLSLYHPHHKRANFERWLSFEWTSRYRYKKCNLQVFVFQSIKIGTYKKWTNPGLFFVCFCLYQTNNTIFTTNICEKMTIQYTAMGFEPTTSWIRVISHNHKTRAPALKIGTY